MRRGGADCFRPKVSTCPALCNVIVCEARDARGKSRGIDGFASGSTSLPPLFLHPAPGLIESKANTKGQRKGWSRITLGDLQNWTKEAVAEAMPDTAAREEIFLALKGVEAAASALWHGSMLELRCSEVPPASELAKLSSRSLAKLIGIVTAVSVNRVVFEAQESYGRRWECMGDLFRQLGKYICVGVGGSNIQGGTPTHTCCFADTISCTSCHLHGSMHSRRLCKLHSVPIINS